MNKKKDIEIDFNSQFNQQEVLYVSDFSTCATQAELFVCAPTGVKFYGQVGGEVCAHPTVEGYFISLRMKDGSDKTEQEWYEIRTNGEFNDCNWGCSLYPNAGEEEICLHCPDGENFFRSPADAEEFYLSYGLAVDKFLKKFVNRQKGCKDGRFFPDFKYSFDFERKNQLAEGWWPVLIQFKFDNHRNSYVGKYDKELHYYNKKHKAYLSIANCD
jgi:hypothetical protein